MKCLLAIIPVIVCACLNGPALSQTLPIAEPALLPISAADAQLRGELSRRCGSAFTVIGTRNFQIIYETDDAWARRTAELLEKAQEQFYRDFGDAGLKPLKNPLFWVCFSKKQDFNNYAIATDQMDMSWLDCYYSTRTNRVVLQRPAAPKTPELKFARAEVIDFSELHPAQTTASGLGLDTIKATHETAHQLSFNSGLLRRGVMYPMWVTEGISTNFEADKQGRFGMGRINPIRRDDLLDARGYGRLLPLAELAVLTQVPVGEGTYTNDLYAQSWGFFRFLYDEHRGQLGHYLRELAQFEPGRRSPWMITWEFQQAFGPAGGLEQGWVAFLDRMKSLRQQEQLPPAQLLARHENAK